MEKNVFCLDLHEDQHTCIDLTKIWNLKKKCPHVFKINVRCQTSSLKYFVQVLISIRGKGLNSQKSDIEPETFSIKKDIKR